MKVVVLIPAHNEAGLIGATVGAAREIPGVSQVIVINDGSTDNTAAIAAGAGAVVVDMPCNAGKGAALTAGWQHAPADVYLLLDGDLGRTAYFGRLLLEPIVMGSADMTIARFQARQAWRGGRMGFGLVRRFAVWVVKRYGGVELSSPLSGQRAVRAEVVQQAGGFAEGFGVEISLTLHAIWAGFRVQEVEVPMKHRPTGRGLKGFWHRGRQLLHIIRTLRRCLKERSQVC
ncbi:MAG: glycosyltransferase family 2 protein [Limnochordia bacterium]|jgi:glycosyltransferase involved in cell wall biosynthesis